MASCLALRLSVSFSFFHGTCDGIRIHYHLAVEIAALPAVCVRALPERRNPSLSASSVATSDTGGMSRPSRSKLTPTKTSNLPSLKSQLFQPLERIHIRECSELYRSLGQIFQVLQPFSWSEWYKHSSSCSARIYFSAGRPPGL